MRKDRFLEAYPHYMNALRSAMCNMDYDEAQDVLSLCITKMLKRKTYLCVKPDKLRSFLLTNVRFERLAFLKAKLQDENRTSRFPDSDTDATKVQVLTPVVEDLIVECPFCFKANLNQYGACAMCHTIVPSHYRTNRNTIRMTEESLAVEFDFNKMIDVQNAVARLSPYEQEVVKAIGLGNESLETFADMQGINRQKLWRVWATAKVKLQGMLEEYAPESLSKRSQIVILRTFQRIEKKGK